MKILNLVQGSDEWLAARSKYHTASEAPSMMGVGYVSRSELLRRKATGDDEEFSPATLALFAKGHEIEALARPIAEGIVGEELFPVTAVDDEGFLLASFDGLSMCETICWECKMWNAEKAADVGHGVLPKVDYWQVVQQLLVSGAEKCLYMVTDGTTEGSAFMWVGLGDVCNDFEVLLDFWGRFDCDLASYAHQEVVPDAVGHAPEDLPALRVEVTGMVTASNLAAFKDHALAVFGGINTELSTDADFADADKTVKWCKDVESRLEAAKDHALSQTTSIDELFRTIDAIKSEARAKRLELDKLVKARKMSIRGEILSEAQSALASHCCTLAAAFGDSGVDLPVITCDIAGAMKGKRTITSLRDAADTEVAKAKVEASRITAEMLAGVAVLRAESVGYESLFADRQDLVTMNPEHLRLLVKGRILDFQAEQDRMLAEQDKAAEEERQAHAEREKAAKAQREMKAEQDRRLADLAEKEERALQEVEAVKTPAPVLADVVGVSSPCRPTDDSLIMTVADVYGVDYLVARGWLLDMVRSEVA